MNEFFTSLQYFHFIRPWWLVLLPVCIVLWWRIRSRVTTNPKPPEGIAPHLASALTVGTHRRFKWLAIDGVVVTLVFVILATTGPTWNRIPNPLIAQTAPLVVVISLSDSMLSEDIPPSRVERAKQKFLDVLATRAGARTALIAYAGSAHQVVPLTEDPEVIKPFVEGLTPEIMPVSGRNASAAFELANKILEAEPIPGAILYITDEIDSSDVSTFKSHSNKGGPKVIFLSLGGLSHVPGATVVSVTLDNADVDKIERISAAAYRNALANDERLQWDDRGWLMVLPAVLITLIWFRRGWTIRWNVIFIALIINASPETAEASLLSDLLLTDDQQGRLLYEDKIYAEAANAFQDPFWKGYALYSAGKYAEAAKIFSQIDNASGAFAQGTAHIKAREYRKGIIALEKALHYDPTFQAAANNLEIAKAILLYIERVREQSDTQEGSEGADEIVFDKEAKGGKDMALSAKDTLKLETAEQWMRGVNTSTAEFLRFRFSLEAARKQ